MDPMLSVDSDRRMVEYTVHRCEPLRDGGGRVIFPVRAKTRWDGDTWLSTTVYGETESGVEAIINFEPSPTELLGDLSLTDAPSWVREISTKPTAVPVQDLPGSLIDAELAAARLAAEAGYLPMPDDQKKSFLLRQALLIHGVPTHYTETNDEYATMQALMTLPSEVVMILARWIYVSGAIGYDRGQEYALKALRRRFEAGPGQAPSAEDNGVVASINVLLTELGISLRP